ncbi:hypothetical protein G3H63_09355 [Microbacterium resistens]|uniref:hypothetical protein n=1 Tax=Microbacterium resistens TaxID=156977 RepID=UPI001C582D01|nr:hypothetical protein [Microbacterium resistens]MBW1639276.1 hypothetical protein [Microbacterium resistens]
MAERLDHAAEAVRLIEGGIGPSFDQTRDGIALAQAHATLALVEQQRIANLIALAALPNVNGFENEVYDARTEALMRGLLDTEAVPAVAGYGPAGIEERVFIRPDIREGLGL